MTQAPRLRQRKTRPAGLERDGLTWAPDELAQLAQLWQATADPVRCGQVLHRSPKACKARSWAEKLQPRPGRGSAHPRHPQYRFHVAKHGRDQGGGS